MEFNFTGDVTELLDGIEILHTRLQYVLTQDGIKINVQKQDYGLTVSGKNSKYSIFYSEKNEFFRGLAILINKLKNEEQDFYITETKKFDTCGIMIDVSRNAVLKVETVQDIFETIALMGINMVMLYMEDIYKIDKYPYFGYMRGAYTQEEIKKIDLHAQKFGIELIPCIQTLAHLSTALRWSYANNMKDNADTLLIDEPETYVFIEEMIRTITNCFTSKKIHLGMDEAVGAGLGKYLQINGYEDRFTILTRHLSKIKKITDKYGLKPMIWSDMFITSASKTHDYYDINADISEEISEKIPQGVSMVYWDYYSESPDIYRASFRKHKQLKREIIFAGGIWIWGRLTPCYDKTFVTTKAALQVCREKGIKHIMATMWGDNGAECSIYTSLLGIQLYAEYNYYENVSDEHLEKMFKICTGYDMDAFLLLETDKFEDERAKDEHWLIFSKQVLYQDVLMGLFDETFKHLELKNHYKLLMQKINQLPRQKGLEYLFDYQKQLIYVLYNKCDIGIRLTKAYEKKNRTELMIIIDELDNLNRNIKILHEKLADIWHRNNKGFGFDRLDMRFGGLEARVDRAAKRINDYLDGKIEKIEELEEKKLLFNGIENPFEMHESIDRNINTVTQI